MNKKYQEYLINALILIPSLIYMYNTWPTGNIIFEFSYYFLVWGTILSLSLHLIHRVSIIGLLPTLFLVLLGDYLTNNFKPWTFLDKYNELGIFFASILLILIIITMVETLFIAIKNNKSKQLLCSAIITVIVYYFFTQETLTTITAWLFMLPLWKLFKFDNEIVKDSIITKSLIYNPKTNTYKKRYCKLKDNSAISICIWFYFLIVLPVYLYHHKDHILTVLIDMIKLTNY